MVSLTYDLLENDPSEENEEDLSVSQTEAVITSTDWTTETILLQLKRGNIELSPRFQRREAWNDSRKSKFIESLFLGLPVPQIVLAERKDKKGSYIVIDGKQRLLSIRKFGVDIEEVEEQANLGPDQKFEPLTLSELKIRSDLNGESWISLSENPSFGGDIALYENQTIRSVVVKNWPDESFLYMVFLRLNTGSVPLSSQELRQALNPGPFTDFVERISGESGSLQKVLHIEKPDFRMRDVELLIRFYAFSEFIRDYDGNLKLFLDRTAKTFNANWESNQEYIKNQAQKCNLSIDATYEIFGSDAFRLWSGGRFEGRFNRAVLDIMSHYFSDPSIAKLAITKKNDVIESFQSLCENNADFSLSLRTTTKSVNATFTRFQEWGNSLKQVLGVDIDVPERNKPSTSK